MQNHNQEDYKENEEEENNSSMMEEELIKKAEKNILDAVPSSGNQENHEDKRKRLGKYQTFKKKRKVISKILIVLECCRRN